MNNDENKELDEELLDDESEGEVPSSDYSDYEEEYPEEEYDQPQSSFSRDFVNGFKGGLRGQSSKKSNEEKKPGAKEALERKKTREEAKRGPGAKEASEKKEDKSNENNKQRGFANDFKNGFKAGLRGPQDTNAKNKLNNRKEKTLSKLNNKPGDAVNQPTPKKSSLPKKENKAGKQAKEKVADKAKKATKEAAKKAGAKAKQAFGVLLKSLAANPYFWIAVGILAVAIILIVLIVVLYAAYDSDDESGNSSSLSTGTKVCSFNVNGTEMSDIKVKLLECDGSDYISGEELVDFDKYITGVVYAENGGAPSEALKAQAIAAKSYVLNRPSVMGGNIKIEEENGQYILSIRNCTNDQVYCDPDQGCWSNSKTAGDTVHSGYDSSKAYSKPALSQDSEIRTAVSEVSDKILVDSSGNPFGASFNSSTQISWNNAANNGKTYSQILSDTYSDATLSTATCTMTGVASGNCSTSTPLKLSEGEDYVVTSTFGYRSAPTAGASTYHKGVDLSATTGTPIYSIFDGTVTHAGNYGSGGTTVIIDHDLDGDGKTDYKTEYMHMSKMDVKINDTVTGGQKIGEVGSTGVSTGPHLHFGLRDSTDTHIDPLPTLNELKSKTSVFDTAEVCNNVTTSDNTGNGGTFSGNFPYYNQCTGSWGSKIICDTADYSGGVCTAKETVCTSGCGHVSFAIIASGLNNDSSIEPIGVVDFLSKYSSNSGGGAVTDAALINEDVLNNYNLKAEVLFPRGSGDSIETKKSKIVSALQSGKAVELLVPGHFVALVGIDENEKITLYDPGKVENVGTYTIDELHNLFKVQRAKKCSGCSDSAYFVYAVAYRKKLAVEQ